MQKILAFDRYKQQPPSASDHRVTLVRSETDLRPLIEDVSLQELYDDHVGPGKLLYAAQQVPKMLAREYEKLRSDDVPSQANKYAILPAHTLLAYKTFNRNKGKHLGRLKHVPVSLANPIEFTKGSLDRAYQFIEADLPVEFRMRLSGKKKKNKKNEIVVPDPAVWQWMHAHFPHLRPDFILKCMPERTEYLVEPVTDGHVVQFVLGRRSTQTTWPSNLTQRLFRVKDAVSESLAKSSAGAKKLKKDGRLKRESPKPLREQVVHEQKFLDTVRGHGVGRDTSQAVRQSDGAEPAREERERSREFVRTDDVEEEPRIWHIHEQRTDERGRSSGKNGQNWPNKKRESDR